MVENGRGMGGATEGIPLTLPDTLPPRRIPHNSLRSALRGLDPLAHCAKLCGLGEGNMVFPRSSQLIQSMGFTQDNFYIQTENHTKEFWNLNSMDHKYPATRNRGCIKMLLFHGKAVGSYTAVRNRIQYILI